MRCQPASFAVLLLRFCNIAATSFVSAARAKFAQPLALALDVYGGTEGAQRPLRHALAVMNGTPPVQALREFGRADFHPDFALVRFALRVVP